jgi:hypothetical protein
MGTFTKPSFSAPSWLVSLDSTGKAEGRGVSTGSFSLDVLIGVSSTGLRGEICLPRVGDTSLATPVGKYGFTTVSASRDGETLLAGPAFGPGTELSIRDIAPSAFAPARGDARPPSAVRHLPADDELAGAGGVDSALTWPAAGVDGAR